MFKKQFATKTEAPLRGSDRRKLRASVVAKFHLEPQRVDSGTGSAPTSDSGDDVANLLVPEGIKSTKYTNSTGETGLLYISPDGDPLWFTEGDRNPDVVPSIYTLWKISLLPVITTAPVAIESLIGGSDLFIPGIFSVSSDAILSGALVSIASAYAPTVPLAVGKLLLDSKEIKEDEKGKAVHVLHTWKDALWQSGNKGDPPTDVPTLDAVRAQISEAAEGTLIGASDITTQLEKTAISSTVEADTITAEDADIVLRDALLQCLSKIHKSGQFPDLPIPASTFYSAYILPNRRYIHSPSSSSTSNPSQHQDLMKRSTHKKLSKFLEAYEKEGLFRLKKITKPSPDLLILSLNHAHASVQAHDSHYKVVGEEEEKRERKERAGKEREEVSGKAVEVLELWKVHGKGVIALFDAFESAARRDKLMSPEEAAKAWPGLGDAPSPPDSSSPPPDSEAPPNRQQYYTSQDLIALLNAYIASENLVHPRDRKYIVPNAVLKSALFPAKPSKKGAAAAESGDAEMFVTRDELLPKLKDAMQGWYEVSKGGKEPVRKKGTVQPIQIKTAQRAGKKVATLITNFEPFLIDAEALAESLRHLCASATSVGPKEGGGAGLEVLVQGKHTKIATDLLVAEGVPKKWIDTVDGTANKKKK